MNIYVGNLPRSITNETLKSLFSQYGDIKNVTIIMDRMTNMPRGFAFVDMPNDDEANHAIVQLNGFELEGRKLSVNQARERDEQGPRQGGGYSSRPRYNNGNGNGSGSRPSYGSKGPRSSSSRNSWSR